MHAWNHAYMEPGAQEPGAQEPGMHGTMHTWNPVPKNPASMGFCIQIHFFKGFSQKVLINFFIFVSSKLRKGRSNEGLEREEFI